MSTFEGSRTINGVEVTVDGRPLDRALQIKTYDGGFFEWGYEGDAPMQLSLAILSEYLGDSQKALSLANGFMKEIVANLGNDWQLISDDIRTALLNLHVN